MFGLMLSKRMIAVGALTLAAVMLLPGCGGRRADQARQMGDVHLQNRNFSEAQSKYEEALTIDPENAQAQLGIAHVARQRGELEAALAGYDATIALDESIGEAYVQAARIHLSQAAPDKAAELADALAQVDERAGKLLRASVHRAQGQTDEAITLLESVREASPGDANVRVDLAQAYMQKGNVEGAEAELRAAIESEPDALRARMMLVNVLRSQGRLADMETELRDSIGEEPVNDIRTRALQMELVQVILGQGRTDEALEMAEAMAAESPDQPWVQYVYANCLIAADKRPQAIQAMQKAATGLPDEPDVAEALARLQRGDSPESETVATAPTATSTPTVEVAQAQPAIGLDTDDWRLLWNSASLQQLLMTRDRFASDDDPMLKEVLVLAAMFTGRDDLTQELLRELPNSSPLAKLYAAVSKREGENALAIVNDWQEADSERAVLSTNARGFVHAMIGLRAKALEIFIRALRAYPENGVALYNTATMYNSAGMPEFAARALSKLLEQAPNALEVRVLLYQTQRRAGLKDEALATAEVTYSLFPNERDTIINLGHAYLDSGNIDLALKVFSRGAEVLEGDTSFMGSLALAYMQAGQLENGAEVLNGLTFEGREAARAAELLAYSHVLAGDADSALAALEGVDETTLSNGGVLVHTAALLAKDMRAEAAGVIAKGAERDPLVRRRGQLLMSALGESEDKQAAQSESLIAALSDDNEAAADYALALASISFRIMRPAVDLLERVEAKAGTHPPLATLLLSALTPPMSYPDRVARAEVVASRYSGAYVYPGLAGVYASAGDPEGQQEALERGVAAHPDSDHVWRTVALEAGQNDDLSRAVTAYERILELGEGNGAIWNNYAYYLLRTDGNKETALEYARKAAEAIEGDPKAIHTLGMALLAKGAVEEALQQLDLAAQMRPGDPTTLLDLGRALIAMDREEEGKSLVIRALKNADALGLDFDRRDEAEAIVGENG